MFWLAAFLVLTIALSVASITTLAVGDASAAKDVGLAAIVLVVLMAVLLGWSLRQHGAWATVVTAVLGGIVPLLLFAAVAIGALILATVIGCSTPDAAANCADEHGPTVGIILATGPTVLLVGVLLAVSLGTRWLLAAGSTPVDAQ